MQQLLQKDQKKPNPQDLNIKTLGSLLSYLEYLTSNKIEFNEIQAEFDSDSLKNCHIGTSVLLIDKYINCAIPDVQLELLLESQGKQNYHADLVGFKHSICETRLSTDGSSGDKSSSPGTLNEKVTPELLSEIFSPNIVGEHYNPYKRFQSCASSASRTCSKLMDLAGLELVDLSSDRPHDNIFLDIVCTFPSIVDFYIVGSDCRTRSTFKTSKNGKNTSQRDVKSNHLIDRMNNCRAEFLQKLQESSFFTPDGNVLGCSSSLHIWSSEVPILPNCHVHNLVPFWSYSKKPDSETCLAIREDIFKDFNDEGVVVAVDNPQIRGVVPGKILFRDVNLVQKFIVDEDRYKDLRLELSSLLSKELGFQQCWWHTPTLPVDVEQIKTLWSDIVYSEFQDIMENWESLDVRVKWIPWYNKSKLLHRLQYKTRPPVLDLDLFFKKVSGIITNYNTLNTSKVVDYLDYQLQIAVKCSNIHDINRYESLLRKAEHIFNNFSDQDIWSWLEFLSVWVTDTRVYGFWHHLKKYMLDPEHKILVEQIVCPICNGLISSVRNVDYCIVERVVVRTRSKFLIYDIKGPPEVNI